MDLEELLDSLPPYLHDEDEVNRLFLMITKEITGKWQMAYETEGRHYHAVSAPTLKECAEKLKAELITAKLQ